MILKKTAAHIFGPFVFHSGVPLAPIWEHFGIQLRRRVLKKKVFSSFCWGSFFFSCFSSFFIEFEPRFGPPSSPPEPSHTQNVCFYNNKTMVSEISPFPVFLPSGLFFFLLWAHFCLPLTPLKRDKRSPGSLLDLTGDPKMPPNPSKTEKWTSPDLKMSPGPPQDRPQGIPTPSKTPSNDASSSHPPTKTSIHSPINQSINQSINQLIYRSIDRSIDRSINQSINQSIDQSLNQSINQSINYSINHTIDCRGCRKPSSLDLVSPEGPPRPPGPPRIPPWTPP